MERCLETPLLKEFKSLTEGNTGKGRLVQSLPVKEKEEKMLVNSYMDLCQVQYSVYYHYMLHVLRLTKWLVFNTSDAFVSLSLTWCTEQWKGFKEFKGFWSPIYLCTKVMRSHKSTFKRLTSLLCNHLSALTYTIPGLPRCYSGCPYVISLRMI